MKRVVLLAPTPPPAGGIAGWTLRMMSAQLKDGWAVDVVDEKLIGKTETFGEGSNRHLVDEIIRTRNIWSNLKDKLKDTDVRVVHSCIPSTTFAMIREYICALITHRYKSKFIIHFRCTTPNTTKGIVGNYILKKLCSIADYIIVLNTPSLNHLKKICNTGIEIIPNFVDESEIIAYRSINKKINRVLYVGGVIPSKGCNIICDVAKRYPDIEFRMVGKSDHSVAVNAKSLNNVVLTGPKGTDQVKEELQKADLFLFVSHFRGEGFSNALAEAMAFGLPCVVSDWAANADMIENEGGIVVPVEDVDATSDAIGKELDYSLRVRQSEYNINKVKKEYSSKVVLDRYVDCYNKMIEKE